MNMKFQIDPLFRDHFRNLKQVFLYVTDQCNLYCEQCIYKPNITFHDQRQIPLDTAIDLIMDFHELGARKLTILGGEPTLYGAAEGWKPLLKLIEAAKTIGYEYVRIDTNGQFSPSLLQQPGFHRLDEIAFSLDGFSSETNDPVRGTNTFQQCVSNIDTAVSLGYTATITCCVHRTFVQRGDDGEYLLHTMIRFAEQIGIDTINFHDLFKTGVPMDTWTGQLNTSVEEHVAMYDEIRPRVDADAYTINVRLPQCFVTDKEFARNPTYYGYCPVKMGERVMVHPNGVIRICSNLICSTFGVARYYDRTIWWDRSDCNELRHHQLEENTPCTNRSKNMTYGEFVPLCFSFKPNQNEYVWKEMLEWDQHQVPFEQTGAAEQCN
jgi:molybdenum cofactor biosynthesis enzyme MoaA